MSLVFADTSFFIALQNRRDPLHPLAVSWMKRLSASEIVTSEYVLVETLNGLSRFGGEVRRRTAQFVRAIESESDIEIVSAGHALFIEALALYEQVPDKRWGLVDCSSFCIMRRRGIAPALNHDRDFGQAGFDPLLRGETT